LTFKGVVFNEMKGALSSPDDLLGELSQQSLYPNTPYGLNSGGDPAVIPDLTYAEFKAFHETYYHPSNAYIYFYGDDPEEERLRLLDAWLQDFDAQEVPSALPLQPQWDAPKRFTHPYDSGDSEDAKAYLTVNWLMPESAQAEIAFSLSILSHILLATPASPLKKALLESGLGEDVLGGYQEELRQGYFSAGMKGVLPENLTKVEEIIHQTLADLAQDGIDPETVAASLNTIEFRLREQNTGRFPRGLALMLNALIPWLYDANPLDGMAFEAEFNAIKARQHSGYFESLIRQHLLHNPHCTTLHLLPDPQEGKRREAAEIERLAQTKAALSPEEIERLMEQVQTLKKRQETPDTPEALATIPALTLADIDPKVKHLPLQVSQLAGVTWLTHDLPTNGIVYLDAGFDLHNLPADLLPFVGLLGRALLQMGTQSQDYVSLIQRIGKSTGGIHSSVFTSSIRESDQSALYFFLRGKATLEKAPELLAILREVLLSARLDNRERFKQIVLEEKAGAESSLIPSGHAVVNSRLSARFSESGWVSEQINGLENLFFLRRLAEEMENDWQSVLQKLEQVRDLLLTRAGMMMNLTLDAASTRSLEPALRELLEALPAGANPAKKRLQAALPPANANEGLSIPAQVNYVGKGANLYALGYEPHGSVHVIRNYLGTTWLWEKVRVQGGAYGGFSVFETGTGTFSFLSYRDPNLLATLENYDNTAAFLRNLELSESELTKTIIGTIGDLDAYLLPDAKGWASMARYLTEYSDEERQKIRTEVLQTSLKDFRQFAEVLARINENGTVIALGSAEALEKANAERPGFLPTQKVL
jgi:Zn-dependent M16 (insulinase) family peptidase